MLYAVVESIRYENEVKSTPLAIRKTPEDAFSRAHDLAKAKAEALTREMGIRHNVVLEGTPGTFSRWQLVGPEGEQWEWFDILEMPDHD